VPYKERLPWSMDRVTLVTGSRDFKDREYIWRVLDHHMPSLIVHGGATGVDTLADQWAYWNGVPRTTFAISKKQWDEYGKAEGGHRNGDMVIYLRRFASVDHWGDFVWDGIDAIVFPGYTGTENMRRKLAEAGIPWWDYRDGGEPASKLGRIVVP
jgi:hypothetical protein